MARDAQLTVIKEGRFIRMVSRGGWEFVQRLRVSGIVVIAALTDDRRVLFVEQHRPPVDALVVELPAGLAGDAPSGGSESLEDAARRELLEETGYRAESLSCVTSGPISAGVSSEIITMYVALDVKRAGPGGGDASEDIRVHAVPVAEVDDWLQDRGAAGALVDPKVFSGLYFLRAHAGC